MGPLYGECKDNPMGVSREQLQKRLYKLVYDGCVLDCNVDEMIKTCQLKSHYPLCAKDRNCIEETWPKQTGIDKLSYEQYTRSKTIENDPDTDDEEEDEEECNICLMDEDEDGNKVKELGCGHKSHISCLIKVAQQKGVDNAECPECRKVFSLEEVPVPIRNMQQRMVDSSRRSRFNASQMGYEVPDLEHDEREAVRLREEARLREREREESRLQEREREEQREREQRLNENFINILNQLRSMRINDDRIFEENEIEKIKELIMNLRNVAVTQRELDITRNYISKLRGIANRRQQFLESQERIRRQQEREEIRQQERQERIRREQEREERRQQERQEIGETRTRSGRVSRRRQ